MARSPCRTCSRARAGTASRRSISARRSWLQAVSQASGLEAANAHCAGALAAPAFDDALTAALGRAAVIAVVAALVVQIRSVRLSRPTRVADDLADLDGRHGRLRSVLGGNQSRRIRAAFTPFGRNRVSGRFRRRTPRRNIFPRPIVGGDGGDTSLGRAQRKSTR